MRPALVMMLLWPGWAMATEFMILEGHGGPVMGAAISADGRHALTASFDNSVALWDLESQSPDFLDGHEAAVKAAIFLPGGNAASSGDDFDIILWDLETLTAKAVLEGHKGQVAGLAVTPDGARLASASWDGSIGIWDLDEPGSVEWLNGHTSNVSDVAFDASGNVLYSASTDGTIREWSLVDGTSRTLLRHGFAINRLLIGDGWLAYGAVDGGTRVVTLESAEPLADLTLDRRPILAMAAAPDGGEISIGDGQGYIMSVSTADWSITRDLKAAANGPIWALAYTADGKGLLAGGIDDSAYLWPVEQARDLPRLAPEKRVFHTEASSVSNGERQFLRKCSICHALVDDGKRRAGPPLDNLFGRPAGVWEDYRFSTAVADSGVVWDAETIDRLFDLGPEVYLPGTKMPMQRIVKPEDRRDLIEFLRHNTDTDGG